MATPARAQLADLLLEGPGVDDHPVAHDAQDAGVQDAGGDQVKDEALLADMMVWPALWPPLKRATTWTFSVSRSTILPLPSSPHWAPAITMFGMMRTSAFYAESYIARMRDLFAAVHLLIDGRRASRSEDMESVARDGAAGGLAPGARAAVARARKVVDDAVAQRHVVYGVNTGFGNFADVVIPARPAARAAAQPRAQPRRGRRRAARRARRRAP